MLVKGETVNIALMIDDFAGASQTRAPKIPGILDINELTTTRPTQAGATGARLVKIRKLPGALKGRWVEMPIELT
ncbi:MAG: hypothetical protein ACU84Q_02875 [Gammaproteobacteria bacterium]